jgi:hypothetical protein
VRRAVRRSAVGGFPCPGGPCRGTARAASAVDSVAVSGPLRPPRRQPSLNPVVRSRPWRRAAAELLAVRRIGPRRARQLIDALGLDWRTWIDLAPERVFGTLRGVGPRQAAEAATSWRARSRVIQSATGPDTSSEASV